MSGTNDRDFTFELDRSPGVIARLVAEAGYEGHIDPWITDEHYPTRDNGIVAVRFRIVPGVELKNDGEDVHRDDVEREFTSLGLRFPNAAEACLPAAKDRLLGRGDRRYAAFIQDSIDVFRIDGDDRRRSLFRGNKDKYHVLFGFLGVVVEQPKETND